MTAGTDMLRELADDLDEQGLHLDAFVIVAGLSGDIVRVLCSGSDREAAMQSLTLGADMLRGGRVQ